jgi:lysophospholipase L1-like esterase
MRFQPFKFHVPSRIARRLATYCLVLFLLNGGLGSARKTALADELTGPFAKEMQAFAEQDKKQPPPASAVLFVGSSSIRMWKVAESFPDLPVINRGFGGSQISHVLQYFDRVVTPYKPRVIVFYSGDNDVAGGKSSERVASDFAEFLRRVHETLPGTPVVVISTKPSIKRWKLIETIREANGRLAAMAKDDPLLHFVDVHPAMLNEKGEPRPELFLADGLHMNAEGYKIWTELVRPWIEEKKKSAAAPAAAK